MTMLQLWITEACNADRRDLHAKLGDRIALTALTLVIEVVGGRQVLTVIQG